MSISIMHLSRLFFLFSCTLLAMEDHDRCKGIGVDQMALTKLKEGIVSDPEGFLSNWTETSPVCKWNGIVCNSNGEVSELTLKRKHLKGTISPFLSNLSTLTLLEFSDNSLHGSLPAELGSLENLEFLGIQGNRLEGEIPNSFGLLTNLLYIDLSKNRLQGPIPSSLFYNCTQLIYVDLSNNLFNGSIPPEIGNHLPKLEDLFLYLNQLSGTIPVSLSNSTNMRAIDLENNYLTGTLPSQIVAQMPFLEELHLSYNSMSSDNNNTNLIPFFSSLSNLTHLKELELAANYLGGELPLTIGLLHVNLSQIHLEDNLIHGVIPKSIANLSNLTLLNLSNNILYGTIPPEICLLPKLERLCLSNNSLEGEIPADLGTLYHLGLLDLSDNKLSGPVPTSFENLIQLRKLMLNGNQLSGTVPPNLGKCVNLDMLDLSHNMFTGKIPAEVAGLSNMATYFNLSNNLLTGMIPMELSKMGRVWEIDLSANNLSGRIPPNLESCQEVGLLNLSHNSLQGHVPISLSELLNIRSMDLSFNRLSGDIPSSFQKCPNLMQLDLSFNNFSGVLPTGGIFDTLSYESIEGNPYICGSLPGLPSCKFKKITVMHSQQFLLLTVIIVSMSTFLLTILSAVVYKKVMPIFTRKEGDTSNYSPDVMTSHPRITYRELWEATRGFEQSGLIGSGSFGHVYKGVLRDGTDIAVKVLQLQTGSSNKTFSRECQVLKRTRHRNLMGIITACSLPDFKALVLPFMANGSLESHLYPQEHISGTLTLNLPERLNICCDIAEGMAYLHHHSPVQIIHCDLKPSNVLLNDEMTALVSDFGIAKLVMTVGERNAVTESSSNSTANLLVGSIGYVAPEYGYGRTASTKGDVYSFGILVLEMLTGKRPTDDMFYGGMNLHRWVKKYYHSEMEKVIHSGLLQVLWDKNPEIRKMLDAVIAELLELGLLCTQEDPSSRPTMIEVADDLNRLKSYLRGDTTATLVSSHGISSSTITDRKIEEAISCLHLSLATKVSPCDNRKDMNRPKHAWLIYYLYNRNRPSDSQNLHLLKANGQESQHQAKARKKGK